MLVTNSSALIANASQESQVNFEKLEAEYNEKVLRKYNEFNANASLIKARKREFHQLKFQIQTQLESNLKLEYKGKLQEHYFEVITEFRHQLKIKEHMLECYLNMFSRLYKENILISRRYEDEMKQGNLRHLQLDQYKNIQTNAIKMVKSKKAMLAKITELNDMENINQEKEIKQRNQVAIQLKASVNILLNNITNEELELNTVKAKQDIVIKEHRAQGPLNVKISKEIISNRKDFFRMKLLLYGICKEMQAKNYNEMIETFNTKKFKETKQLTQFKIENNHIRDFSMEYYHNTQELLSLNSKIKDKRRYESVLNDKIEKATDRLRYLASLKVIQSNSISDKQTVLNAIVGYMLKYSNQICKLTNKPLISVSDSKALSYSMGKCLQFFINLAQDLFQINSVTLHKAVLGYFVFGHKEDNALFNCVVYSNEDFIAGYKDYHEKISEQYHRMLDIINQSIQNHIQDRRNSIELPLFNQFSLVRRTYKKRSNILQLSNGSEESPIAAIKEEFYLNRAHEDLFPEFSFDKGNEEDIFNDGKKLNKKCIKKKKPRSSYSLSQDTELYMYRMNDIRKLKLQYFIKKEKSPILTQGINEFYHRLKKRFSENQLQRIKSKKKNSCKGIAIKLTTNVLYTENHFINTTDKTQKLYLTEPFLPQVSSSQKAVRKPKVVQIKFHNPKSKGIIHSTMLKKEKSPSSHAPKSHSLTYTLK